MKSELVGEINGRLVTNEVGDPPFLIHKFKLMACS